MTVLEDIRTRWAGKAISKEERDLLLDFINTRVRLEEFVEVAITVTHLVPKGKAADFQEWLVSKTLEWDWNEVAGKQGAIKVSYHVNVREVEA
jgi:hypothetical protein